PAQIPGGASYSRFVIPFAYRLTKSQTNAAGKDQKKSKGTETQYCYENDRALESGGESNWRRNYFTSETAAVLFDKAKWFRLKRINYQDNGGKRRRTSAEF